MRTSSNSMNRELSIRQLVVCTDLVSAFPGLYLTRLSPMSYILTTFRVVCLGTEGNQRGFAMVAEDKTYLFRWRK